MDWPSELTIIRHGESAGNVARDLALARSLPVIPIAVRDCDVPLSPLGREQSAALGRWLSTTIGRPEAVFCSPYARAVDTAAVALNAARWNEASVIRDERVREKEFGILDRLTRTGIEQRFPDEVTARQRLGKFYYRPPGGESWVDVILRLRSFCETMRQTAGGAKVIVVTHQVIVLCLRYIIESLGEAALLAIDDAGDVANCGVTKYRLTPAGVLKLSDFNSVAPLEREGVIVTSEPDQPSDAT